jgi:lipoprotein-anchoring transpeptidase ErfK/SrfK
MNRMNLPAFLILSALLGACAREDILEAEESSSADTTAEAVPLWSDEPLLTQEEIEQGRYDDSWREAASIDSLVRAARVMAGRDSLPIPDLPSDSIAIPETWDDIEDVVGIAIVDARAAAPPAIHLPLGGRVEGPSVLYLQVLLDHARFSPGVIDGKWGQNTEKAVYWLQRREELPATGIVDSLTYRRIVELAGHPDRYVNRHVLAAEDVAGPFVEIPEGVYQQADLECLCYSSLGEKLAERFHSTEELLARLNPEATLDSLAAGDTLLAPAVVSDTLAAADTTASDTLPQIARLVVSDRGEYLHALDADGRIVYHFPSTLGSRYDPSPEGSLTVTRIALQPWFHYQPELLGGADPSSQPTQLPPGPNNPVGLVWMQLSEEHYGIHGTSDPGSIGYTTSSGCIRLTNWDALLLAGRIEPGVPVEFRDAARVEGEEPAGGEPSTGNPTGG